MDISKNQYRSTGGEGDITDNVCTKQGNSSIKTEVYKQERLQIKSW